MENESAPRVEQYLSKIKVIRKIARKIIEFLAQLEDFQRKLWLKKKLRGRDILVLYRGRVHPGRILPGDCRE